MATRTNPRPSSALDGPAETSRPSSRRQATRDKLVEAARRVVAAKGVNGASVEEICEAAGFTRGAFYSNYADKDALILDLLQRERARIFGAIDLAAVTDDIDTTVEALLSLQRPDPLYLLLQSELTLHALRTPDFVPVMQTADAEFRTLLQEVLARGMERLGLEPVVTPEELAEVVAALLERSGRSTALAGHSDSLALARRTLPHIIRAFTRPQNSPDRPVL